MYPFKFIGFIFSFQKKTAAGLPIFNLEKKRHGRKYIVKAVKEEKDYSFRDILASWTIEVLFPAFWLK